MQTRWAFVTLKLLLFSSFLLFLISREKLNCILYISFSSGTDFIFFQPVISYRIYNYPNTPTCTAIQEKHISLLLILIFGALIYRFSLILLNIREISPVIRLHLGCSEWTRLAHGHIYTQLVGCLTTSQPSLEIQSTATISHPLGSHLLQWCHTDAARFTSANLVTKQRLWFYQIC